MAIQNPQEIIKKGEEIYQSKKAGLEKNYPGQYVAINVTTKDFFIDDTPEDASFKAKQAHPVEITYLTRIGEDRAVYHLRNRHSQNDNWLF